MCLCLPSVLSLLFVFAAVLFFSVNRADYVNIQKDEFLFINHFLISDSKLWLNITQLGDAMVLFPILSLFIPKFPQIWAALFAAVPLTTLLSIGGKNLFHTPRPAAVLDHNLFNIMGNVLTAHNSLPSGHTVTIFAAITVVLAVLFPFPCKKLHFLCLLTGLVLAIVIAISRVAVGAHWPLDVALGSVLGYLGGLSGVIISQRFHRWWEWMKSPKYQYILGLQVLAFVLAIIYQLGKPYYNDLIIWWVAGIIGGCMSLYLVLKSKIQTDWK